MAKVGIVGLGRGTTLAKACARAGLDVVAVCDVDEFRRRAVSERLHAVAYSDYQAFLEHELDAVVLANAFDEHAAFAIRALESGRHVMSETIACRSIAEGVALIEAVERTGRRYLFAENYPHLPHVELMRSRYRAGDVGDLRYAEGEYVHGWSTEVLDSFAGSPDHWRARIAATAYCTHSVAPCLYVTDLWPTEVSAFVVPPPEDRAVRGAVAIELVRLDNGALLRSLHGFLPGEEVAGLRIQGTRGLLESQRGVEEPQVRFRREEWASPTGAVEDGWLDPPRRAPGFVAADRQLAEAFASMVNDGVPPAFGVERGVAVSLVAICALRSVRDGGQPVPIPDLREPGVRAANAGDDRDGVIAEP